MKLTTFIKKPILIISLLLVILLVAINFVVKELDKAFNEPSGEPRTEIFLWASPGYPPEPQLNFYWFDIDSGPEKIRVVYKIENTSNRNINVNNEIDLAVVDSDANTIGDPGTVLWRWSENSINRKIKKTNLAPDEIFKEVISINRQETGANSQYYINAYYNGELVSQYKVLEGLNNK